MSGDVALTLLKMTGHSGTVPPGALLACDVPAALVRLKQQLDAFDPENNDRQGNDPVASDADKPSLVGLRLRAYPLQPGKDVMSCGKAVPRLFNPYI